MKNDISACKKKNDDFVFIKMDTLTERLRRIRALNSDPANIGITQYTWRSWAIGKKTRFQNK